MGLAIARFSSVGDYGVVDDLYFVVGDAHFLVEFNAHFLAEGDDLVGEFV